MPHEAKVTSIEALEAFRANLIIYLDKTGRALDEINDEVIRTRLWLESDRRLFWEKELRRRNKELEQAQAEMFTARLSQLQAVNPMQQSIVREAKRAVAEAEEKLARVKQWSRQYDNRVSPHAKEVDKLRDVLGHEMRHAVAWLNQAIKTLSAYAEIQSEGEAARGQTPPAEGGQAAETREIQR